MTVKSRRTMPIHTDSRRDVVEKRIVPVAFSVRAGSGRRQRMKVCQCEVNVTYGGKHPAPVRDRLSGIAVRFGGAFPFIDRQLTF